LKKPVLSLQEVLELYLAEHEYENSSKATIQYYIWNIGRFIRFLIDEQHIENPKVTDFKAENIIKFIMRLKNSKKWENRQDIRPERRKATIGSQSIRTYARAFRSFGNWLYKEHYIKENILDLIKLPKAHKKDIEILTASEIELVFNTFDRKSELGLRNAIIFALSVDLGIRQGGIANLTIKDADFTAKTLRVRLKGGDTTLLPLGKTVLYMIKEYKIKYRSCAGDDEPLLLNKFGDPLTENAIKKMFTALKEKTGIERISCHLGRHTFATNYRRDGHTEHEVQLALAQRSDVAAKEYVHLAERITLIEKGADSYLDKMNSDNQKKGRWQGSPIALE
jgi:site-specific recombinase XerD